MTADTPSLADFEALSFDCYGTLIDWETGLLEALEPLLARAPDRPTRDQALEAYAGAESDAEAKHPTDRYPEILSRVWLALAAGWGVADDPAEREAFARSVGDWRPFPDTVEALRSLQTRFKLVILSNVDRTSFAATNRRLEVAFDRSYTAEDVGSYKPDPRNFAALVAAVEEMGVPRAKLLHVAQSLFHDHVPAQAIGLATCWIDRRAGLEGGGATRAAGAEVAPEFTFPTLTAFADAVASAGPRTG